MEMSTGVSLLRTVQSLWQIQVPIGTGISAQEGMILISKIKINHMGQFLGNMGGRLRAKKGPAPPP